MTNVVLVALLVASLPNLDLTPGAVQALTRDQVCATRWGADRRYVSDAMKKHVAAAYGVPWADRGLYEFDHLIPRELGGADSLLNLWPQPWDAARQKDRLENRLHVLVCAGQLTLSKAQADIRRDWVTADATYAGKNGSTR